MEIFDFKNIRFNLTHEMQNNFIEILVFVYFINVFTKGDVRKFRL